MNQPNFILQVIGGARAALRSEREQESLPSRRLRGAAWLGRGLLLALAGTGVGGCAKPTVEYGSGFGSGTGQTEDTLPAWENRQPELRAVSPGRLAAGDPLTLAGRDFIAPEFGRAKLELSGTFAAQDGTSHDVRLEVLPEYVGPAQLLWYVGPDVPFDPTGERIGTFRGRAVVDNEPYDTATQQTYTSDPVDVEIEVEPSILVRQLRPIGSECGAVVDRTIEGAPLDLVAEAIGIRDGTPEQPLTATYQMIAPQLVALFDGQQLCAGQVVESCSDRQADQDPTPEDLMGPQGAVSFQQEIHEGRRLTLSERWNTRVLVGGQVRHVNFFRIGAMPIEEESRVALLNLRVEDGRGGVARRTVRLETRHVSRLAYDGNRVLAERFAPEQVSACIPGATPATEASYTESRSEVRSRSLSFNWNYSVADTLGFSANIGLPPWNPFMFMVGINASRTWSEGFGTDVAATLSSEQSEIQGLSGQIFPGEFGAFYRQTEKLRRTGIVVGTNECGVTAELGEADLTDWTWSAELAKGTRCPPATRLPAGEVFE